MSAERKVPPLMDDLRAFVTRFWVQLLIGLHAVKMAFWFHAVDPSSAFPLINVDYVQFYGRAMRIHEFLSRSGRIWGYDPFDMAGYLSGPFLEVGTHVLALASHLLDPVVPVALTMLVLELTGLAVAPFFLVVAARLFGATRNQAWTTFGLAVFLTGGVEPFSTGMYKLGLWGWMMSSHLAIVQLGVMWWFLDMPRDISWPRAVGRWAAFAVATSFVFQVHPSSFIIVAGPCAVAYLLAFRRMSVQRHAALALGAAMAGASNWYWISPFIAFPKWRMTAPYYDTAGFLDVLERFGPFQKDFYASVSALLHLTLLVIALRGVAQVWRVSRDRAIVLGSWLAWLALICYFGSSLPWVRTLQPGRNEFPLWLGLYVAAGFSFAAVAGATRRSRILAVLLAVFGISYVFELVPGMSPWSKFAAPLTTTLPSWQRDLVRYLSREQDRRHRVLLECNDDLQPHMADIIPPLTGTILIGGQHPGNFLATRTTLFMGIYVVFQESRSFEPMAFGHRLRALGEKGFAEYLELYNVGRVIARTPQTIGLLSQMTETLTQEEPVAPHAIFRTRRPSTWFAQGSGDVTFDYDRILIDNPSPGVIVLKAHWLSTLKASPVAPMSPVYLMDDPVPFIRVDNAGGHKRIEIYNAGLPPLRERFLRKFRDDWGQR